METQGDNLQNNPAVIDYAMPSAPSGGNRSVLLAWNVIAFIAGDAYYYWIRSGDLIGDAYAPLIAMLLGLPLTLVAWISALFTAGIVCESYRSLHRWQTITLILLAAAALILFTWPTGAMALTPRTHGSGC